MYGATAWTLTKSRLDGIYTRMLRAALNYPGDNIPPKPQPLRA